MGALIFFFLFPFFLKWIVAYRLCAIYVREDNDFNVLAINYAACMDYMDLDVHCSKTGC